jgi:hypothetical protein
MISRDYKALFWTVDSSLRYALGTRLWQTLASCLTLLFILRGTKPAEQGVYYTFASLANLQIFFELGLSFVILQTTSHYFKSLAWGEHGAIYGAQSERLVLLAFARKALWIYFGIGCLFLVLMLPVGLLFFGEQPDLSSRDIHMAWVLLVVGMTLNLFCAPILAMLEGSGKVTDIYRLRLKQLVGANILAWIVFYLTNALFLIVINTWVTALSTFGWLVITHRHFLSTIAHTVFKKLSFSWRKEIWPMQWRIGISWVSGYFINQLFIPLLYHYQGAVISGQMGICLLLANMLGLFAITLVTIRSPKMGELVARGERSDLDSVFFVAFCQSIVVFILGTVAILGLGAILHDHPIMHRFLPWSEMAILFLAYFFSHIMGILSLYLRAHRLELFAPLSVVGAVLMAGCAWYGAMNYGAWGVTWGIFIVNAGYGLPSALWLWMKFKRTWRKNNESNTITDSHHQHSNLEST